MQETAAALGTDEVKKEIVLGIQVKLRQIIRDAEVDLLRSALGQTDGNISQAARALGLNRTTLHEKMRRYGVS